MILQVTRLVVVALVISLLFLTGCSSPKIVKQEPKMTMQQGGQIVYGSLYEPNSLNPLLSDLVATHEIGKLVFSGLVVMNDKGEWESDLAETVPTLQNGGISPDGRTVTYHLRKGVTWHDGQPFTAEDVKFTWQLIMNRKANVISRDGYELITAMETPDPYTVTMRFKEYYAPYLTLFSTILPKHSLANVDDINKAAFNRAPIGTGPFMFQDWKIAEAIILKANANYFRGKPVLDSIQYKFIPDSNILLSQLKAGEVHIASNIAFTELDHVRGIQDVDAVISPGMMWEHIELNLDKELFKDVRVRQALSYALDRKVIVETALKNTAVPAAADQPPYLWSYKSDLAVPNRDLVAVKKLLADAGWQQGPDGIFVKEGKRLSFTLITTAGNKLRENVSSIIVQQAREAGIEINVRPISTAVLFNDAMRTRQFDAALFSWVLGPDPDNYTLWNSKMIPSAMNKYSGQNYSGWRNAEVDQLTELGTRTVNLEERKQIYFRIQELIAQENPVIPLCFMGQIYAVKKNVANFKPNSLQGGLWNSWQWGIMKP